MKLALMQPYFFPYLGYFTLVAAVDRFVFYDDVQYIKNGWINRNRILLAGEPRYVTVPLLGAGSSRRIDEVAIDHGQPWKRKMGASLRHAYGQAPYFEPVSRLVDSVLDGPTAQITDLAKASVVAVARHLGLETEFVGSSRVYRNDTLHAAHRVKDICAREGASAYYNLPGGRALYDAADFAVTGVDLHFVEPRLGPYPQRGTHAFVAGLSVIDVLMNNAPEQVAAMVRPPTTAQG